MIQKIQSLMSLFTKLTGNPVVTSYATQGEAREWLNAGFTEDDLRLMVAHRKRTVSDERIRKNMLRWRFLIGDVQRFAEDLSDARACQRNRKPTASDRAKVLAVTGRQEKREREPRAPDQILKECAILRQFLAENQ